MQKRLSARARAVNIWLMAPLLGLTVFLSVFVAAGAPVAQAATSSNLNFQARLLTNTGTVVPDGNYNIDFKIYNADSTTGTVGTCTSACVWEETRTNAGGHGVQVINGYFSVNLGSVTAFGSSINWDQPLWLTMNLTTNGTQTAAPISTDWNGEMQNGGHSIALTAIPYSFIAGQLAKTSGSNRGTLAFNTVANNPVITLPDETGTVCTTAAAGVCTLAGTGFVQLQSSLGSAQTGYFNISGTGEAGIFQAGTIDTATAVALGIGTTHASEIDLNQNTVLAAGKSLTITGSGTRPSSPTKGMLYFDTTTNQLIKYNGSRWTSAPKSNTEIVAASNSSQAEKDAADFVATGADDGATINNALTALPSGGGSVYLMEGTYTLGATSINVPDNTILSGSGTSTTLTYPSSMANGTYYAITNSDTSAATNITIENLLIDGNKAGQTTGTFNGIYFDGVGSSSRAGGKIYNVTVQNIKQYGIFLSGSSQNTVSDSTANNNGIWGIVLGGTGSSYNTVSNNTADGNGNYGIYEAGTAPTYNVITGNNANNNSTDGIYLYSSANSTVTGNVASGNTSFGIYLNGSSGNTISGNTANSNGYGISIAGGANNSITGNTANSNTNAGILTQTSNVSSTISSNTINGNTYGVEIWSSSNNTVTGNIVTGNTSYGIYLLGATTSNVTGNKLDGNGGSSHNNAIFLASTATANSITNNDITDSSCTTDCYAVYISDSGSTGNYFSGNHFGYTTTTYINNPNSDAETFANQELTNNGDASFRNATNSATAFQVQNAAGSSIFNVDTTNGIVGTAATSAASTSSNSLTIETGNATGTTSNSGSLTIDVGTATGTAGTVAIGTANASGITVGRSGITTGIGGNLDVSGSVAFKKGTDFSANGTTTNASFANASLIRLTGSAAQTIDGIAGGRDGYILTIMNAGSQSATIVDASLSTATTANRVITGTGANLSLPSNNSLTLIYDATASRWRVNAITTSINAIGTYSSGNHYANGATVSGNSIIIGSADASDPGLIDTSNQTFSGNKTFQNAVVVGSGANSATALQIQNSSGSDLLNVNSTDGYVINNGTDSLGNQLQNPGFESGAGSASDGTGWYTPGVGQAITNDPTNAHGGNNVLEVAGNSTTHTLLTKYYAVHPGDTIYVEAWVKNSATANGDGGIFVEYTDKDKANATDTLMNTGLPGTVYTLKSTTQTIPAGKYFVRLGASVKATASAGTFYFDDFYLKRVNEQAPLLITASSSTAFQVQNSNGATVLGVDTSGSKIFTTIADGATAVGFTLNTPSYVTNGAKLVSIQNNGSEKLALDKDGNLSVAGNVSATGNVSAGGSISSTGGITAGNDISTTGNVNIGSSKTYQINGTQITSAALSNNSDLAKLSGTGPQIFTGNNQFNGTVVVQNYSSTGFQVQHAANAVFTVDTSNNRIILGAANNITGAIQFQGSGGAGVLNLVGPTTPDAGNWTLSIPTITTNDTICTNGTQASSCPNYIGSSSLTSGLATKLNKNNVDTSAASVTAVQGNLYAFTNNSNNIASGILKLNNGNNSGPVLTVTGSYNYGSGNAYIVVNNTNATPSGFLVDLQANSASEFNVDASGNVIANGNLTAGGNISIATGEQYQINGVQISSAALSDGSTFVKTNANNTFTGINTFSNASNSFTGDGSNLTNLNATNIASGTLNDGRLTSNVALLNRTGQTFIGDNTFAPTGNNAGTIIRQTSGTATSGSIFDIQTADSTGHFLQITNAAANQGAVTLQSVGGANALTIGSASGTMFVTAITNTIQHNNSSLTIDIDNGTDSTLNIVNNQSGAAASLSVEGDVSVGNSHVYKVGTTSGQSTTCSSNTFLQNATTLGGILTGAACANAVTSLGTTGGSLAGGASISGNALTLGYADTSNPGLVSNTTQSFNGAKTFVNDTTVKDSSNTAFQVQNSSGASVLVVDTNNRQLRVMENGGSTNYSLIYYDTATSTANYTASAGTVAVGMGAGAISVTAGASSAVTITANAASTWKTTAGNLTLQSGTGGSDVLILNGGGGNQIQVNGSASLKLGSTTADPTCTNGAIYYNSSLNAFRGCQGGAWATLSAPTPSLQTAYTNSTGGSTPEIKVDSTRGGVDIQDADTTINGVVFAVRGTNAGGLGTSLFNVNTSNNTVNIGASGTSPALLVLGLDTNSTFNAGTATNAPGTVINGAMFYSSTDHNFMCGQAGSWVSCNGLLYSNTAAGSQVSTCTTACNALGSAPLPANYCQAGRVINLNASGIYTTSSTTLQFGIYWGNNASKASDTLLGGTQTQLSSSVTASSWAWQLHYTITCFTTTSMMLQGYEILQDTAAGSATSNKVFALPITVATGSLTTNATGYSLYIFPTFGASAAGDNATMEQMVVTGN